jgi:sugar lactone lactonase YvrE
VILWDTKLGRKRLALAGHRGIVYSLAFSPDGKTLASASSDSTSRLWDVETGAERRKLSGDKGISSIAFKPDGKTLVFAQSDGAIHLWDVEAGKERDVLAGHRDVVYCLAFSPDGNTLASASNDTTIRFWDVEAAAPRLKLTGHTDGVSSIAFRPDGKSLASASFDKTVRLWPVWHSEFYSDIDGKSAAFDSIWQASFALFGRAELTRLKVAPRLSGKDPLKWLLANVELTPKAETSPDIFDPDVETRKTPAPLPAPKGETSTTPPVSSGEGAPAEKPEAYKIDCAGLSIDLAEPVARIAAALEADSILFGADSLSDNSGIFHRVLRSLQQRCPNVEIPEVSFNRSSWLLARWYDERKDLRLIQNALESADLIRPGAVMFYGASDKLYKDFTKDEVLAANGISHVGVVVSVERDEAGGVISYRLFHGLSPGKIAATTNYHRRQPTRPNLPPFGNWNQQWLAMARLAKSE